MAYPVKDTPVKVPPKVKEYQEWKKLEAQGVVDMEPDDPRARRLAGRPHKKRILDVPKSNIAIRSKLYGKALEYIKRLEKFANSKNERIAFEATRYLFDKILPNAKPTEGDSKHAPISVFINNQGFVPPDADVNASPDRGTKRPAQIQGSRVAPKGEEDDDSDQRDGEAGVAEEGSLLAPISDLRGS